MQDENASNSKLPMESRSQFNKQPNKTRVQECKQNNIKQLLKKKTKPPPPSGRDDLNEKDFLYVCKDKKRQLWLLHQTVSFLSLLLGKACSWQLKWSAKTKHSYISDIKRIQQTKNTLNLSHSTKALPHVTLTNPLSVVVIWGYVN